ncbi:MAG: ferrous iron transport protein A [Desulfocapsa sp.]|nr:ferrous iron transport protein A [Desulfocapsa sp.]
MTLKEINKKCCCLAKKVQKCAGNSRCNRQGHQGPLSENCQAGKVKICKITGDRKLCARMASLGVLPGEVAELLCPQNSSQCLLKIRGGTLSLDQSTSNNIIVQSV